MAKRKPSPGTDSGASRLRNRTYLCTREEVQSVNTVQYNIIGFMRVMESVLQQGEEGSPKRGKIVRRARQRRNGPDLIARALEDVKETFKVMMGPVSLSHLPSLFLLVCARGRNDKLDSCASWKVYYNRERKEVQRGGRL
jgi:hypothetical protein